MLLEEMIELRDITSRACNIGPADTEENLLMRRVAKGFLNDAMRMIRKTKIP